MLCPYCDGLGFYDLGNVEDGVTELCEPCLGTGDVEEDA